MIIETYEYAVKNRDEIISALDSERHNELINKSKEMWIEYHAREIQVKLAGIDSSWNTLPYHGYYLYAVDAVSVHEDGSYAADPMYEVGISDMAVNGGRETVYNPSLWLESRGMRYEHDLSVNSSDSHVLIDGSVLARFYDMRSRKITTFLDYASDLMKMENITFVAKTSTSNSILRSALGDIHYFTKATPVSGFSRPYNDRNGITVTYVRLSDYTPVLRVEIPGSASEREIMNLMDALSSRSFNGYPYVLRVAHDRCKISNSDMKIIEDTLGLETEGGSREVLGE